MKIKKVEYTPPPNPQQQNLEKKEESIKFQLILVDNSHDGNAKAIYETLDFGCDSIYVHEPKPGLSNARNAALAFIGDSEFVCTIDDDIIVPEDFLTRLHSTILKYSDAVIIGGRVELYNSKDLPVTIKTSQEEAIYDGFPLFGFVFGCAMVIKASVFKDIGIFDPNLGAGTKNGGSEDADFLYRAWMFYNKKCSIVYAPHYYVYHNHGRREPSYTNQLQINYAKGQGGFYYKHIVQHKSLYILNPFKSAIAALNLVPLIEVTLTSILVRALSGKLTTSRFFLQVKNNTPNNSR